MSEMLGRISDKIHNVVYIVLVCLKSMGNFEINLIWNTTYCAFF